MANLSLYLCLLLVTDGAAGDVAAQEGEEEDQEAVEGKDGRDN